LIAVGNFVQQHSAGVKSKPESNLSPSQVSKSLTGQAHYYASPGLSWDALFKKMGAELELLTDIRMHLFVKREIQGGISMVKGRDMRKQTTCWYQPMNPEN